MNPNEQINGLPVNPYANNQPTDNKPADNQPVQPANSQPANQPGNDTPKLDLSDIFPVDDKKQEPNNQPANSNQPNDDELDENGKKIMSHVNDVNKKIDDVDQNVDRKIQRSQELTNFFLEPKNEAFKPYQNDIIRVAHDRRYVNYKLDRLIPFVLGASTMLKIGAKMAEGANNFTNSNGTGGNANNVKAQNQPQQKDWNAMSEAEFREHTQKVLSGNLN